MNATAEQFDDENVQTNEWKIRNISDADWALKRLAELKAQIAENEGVAEARIAGIKASLERINEGPKNSISFFEGQLRLWAEDNKELLLKGGKAKSRKLIHGSIGWTKPRAGLSVTDGEALLAWASLAGEAAGLVRVKREPAMSAIQEHYKTTGEIPPGTEPKSEAEEFVVKTKEVGDGDGTN